MKWGLTVLCSFSFDCLKLADKKICKIYNYNVHPTLLPDRQSQILIPGLIALLAGEFGNVNSYELKEP
jgi:hypothetical protein